MKIASLVLALFISSSHFTALATDWSLTDPSKGWNTSDLVDLYFHNSEVQTQWAWEALSNYKFKGDENVLDFGSGDGKLSALMSFMVPNGQVFGVDISSHMVHFALKVFPKSYYKNLTFLQALNTDFDQMAFPVIFDIANAFCVFHFVPNPCAVLSNIRSHLHSKSKLVATYPIVGGNPMFMVAVEEELNKRGWNMPPSTNGTSSIRNPDTTHQVFKDAGFEIEYFKIIEKRHSFSTKAQLIDWLEGTLTANWDIPKQGRREFFSDVVDRYLAYQPQEQDEEGFVYYNLARVDVIARPIF